MTKINKILYLFISIIFFIIFDSYFSELILSSLRFKMPENQIIDIVSVQNTGAAFSILENSRFFLIIFAIIAILCIISYVIKNMDKFSTFAVFWVSLLTAGVCCNLYERITLGYVRDFFSLNFVNFPVFNISDIFINVGVFAIIIIIIKNKYLKNETKN